MLWSLIYRKLRGRRGCTRLLPIEAARLVDLVERENGSERVVGTALHYQEDAGEIVRDTTPRTYAGPVSPLKDVTAVMRERALAGLAYEDRLQAFFTTHAGRSEALEPIVGSDPRWIGNEVACGVGMQRIDVMTINSDEHGPCYRLIELKSRLGAPEDAEQLGKYARWAASRIEDANSESLQPVLVTHKGKVVTGKRRETAAALRRLTSLGISRPPQWFETSFAETAPGFIEVDYTRL